jgi:acyl phosphate:glycerol-3-phosphate acyltransferase
VIVLFAALLVVSYLLGAIPVGLIAARRRGVDITKVGSGNIGATNVLRVLGRKAGLTVLILDVLKGFVPAVVALQVFRDQPHAQLYAMSAGAAALLGHCLSPFLRFRGGKGIATGLGMLLGASPLVAVSAFAVFAVFLLATRFVSLASLVAAVTTIPFALLYGSDRWLIPAYVAVVVFLFARHRANIGRLLAGTEPRFTFGATGASADPDADAERPESGGRPSAEGDG